jgi:CHAT domain-containing protein/Tfp pilus assembly protein PilF
VKENSEYASSLNNMAGLYYDLGDYDRAEPMFQEALDIRRRTFGTNNLYYAISLNNLAALYQSRGEYSLAEPLYREGAEIRKKILGDKHVSYADSLNNLASLNSAMGNYADAESLYLNALNVHKQILGPMHPKCATDLNNIAVMYRTKGEFGKAQPYYRRSLEIIDCVLRQTFNVLSERQQLAMVKSLRDTLDGCISTSLQMNVQEDWLYEYVLSWKGAVFTRQREARLAAAHPELANLLSDLQITSNRLANLAFSIPNPDQKDTFHQQISQLSEKKERLEAELSKACAEFRSYTQQGASIDQLKASLPPECVLIDLLEYFHSTPRNLHEKELPRTKHLVAFVVRRNQSIVKKDLGSVDPIRQAIERWRKSFGQTEDACDASAELRRILWNPLTKYLGTAKIILISPDGIVTRFPFAALPGDKPESYLIEDYSFDIVPVPQSLPTLLADTTISNTDKERQPTSLLLVGDVDYDAQEEQSDAENNSPSNTSLLDMSFPRLSNVQGEIQTVRESFSTAYPQASIHLLSKKKVTKEIFFRDVPECGFLHIATHGFLIFPGNALKSSDHKNVNNKTALSYTILSAGQELASFYPGLLSGLALSGANRAAISGDRSGIITAEEVTAMNMNKTDMVVLSACETGLGETISGEGALGLQRSFQIAGARTVVASLWPVNDKATRTLVECFYKNLWEKKMGKLEALRQTQLWMINNPGSHNGEPRGISIVPKDISPSASKKSTPYYWAPFVLSGDWR